MASTPGPQHRTAQRSAVFGGTRRTRKRARSLDPRARTDRAEVRVAVEVVPGAGGVAWLAWLGSSAFQRLRAQCP